MICLMSYEWSILLVADVLYRRNFSSLLRISYCHLLLVMCASVQYVQSSWCATCCSYTVAEEFFLSVMNFFLCVMVYVRTVVWGLRSFASFAKQHEICGLAEVVGLYLYTYTSLIPADSLCISADFFLSVEDFFLSFTPWHLCIAPVCSE